GCPADRPPPGAGDRITTLTMGNGPSKAGGLIAIAFIALATGVFSALAWTSMPGLNTLWDERVDLDIASALARSPIRGEPHPADPTQFRLPMYVCAAAFCVTGRSDLATARAVSVSVGAIGIAVAGGFTWELFGAEVAVLAAWLLALSPYYLAY